MSVFLLQASSNAHGVTDLLANYIYDALRRAKISVRQCALSSHAIHPCTNCGFCRTHCNTCAWDGEDRAGDILDAMRASQILILCAPIYFYALPAQCKALIDRSQRYWHSACTADKQKPTIILLHAGRKKGEKLFDGANLTLRYFLALLSRSVFATYTRRGLETRDDLLADTMYLHKIEEMIGLLPDLLRSNGNDSPHVS